MKQKDGLRAKKVGMSLVVVISMLISGIAILDVPVTIAQETIGGEYGGSLRTALQAEPSSLNPLNTTLNESAEQIIDLLYESLGRIDPDSLNLVPWMASSWEVNATDESIVYVTLRDGILWHDGTEVTLDDVIYSFGTSAHNVNFISSMSKDASSNTITFNLAQPDARFFAEVMEMKIVQNGTTVTGTSFVGCGPFILDHSDSSETLLVANDKHFIARPYLDSIIFTYYPYVVANFSADYLYTANFGNEDPRWDGCYRASHDLLKNKIDFIGWGLSSNQITVMVEKSFSENNTLMLDDNITVKGSYGFNTWYLGFNNAPNHVFNDVALRKAITYVIDKDFLTSKYDLTGGLAQTESVLSQYNVPWYNNSIVPYGVDMIEAEAILDSAGYMDDNGDGWRELPDKTPFSLTLLGPLKSEYLTQYSMSTSIMTWFANLGLNVTLVSDTSESNMAKINSNNFDMYLADEMSGSIDPQFIYDIYHSEATTNLLNFAGEYVAANETQIEKIDNQGLVYKGEWDANLNTPILNEATDISGWYYNCSVAGTQNFSSGSISFDVGDWIVHNETQYLKVTNHTWSFTLNYTKILDPIYVYHNDTLLANDTWEFNYITRELTLKGYPLNFDNDTVNVTYNYIPFDHYIEMAGNQMEPADRAEHIKDALAVITDLCPSVPVFSYKVNYAYVTGNYVGWVDTLDGLGNYWTYINLKNELVGDLDVTLSCLENFITAGDSMPMFIKVLDMDGLVISKASIVFSDEDVFTDLEWDNNGLQYNVTFTAPNSTISKTLALEVTAHKAGYSSDSTVLGMTVHPQTNNFDIDVVRGNTTLASGEETSITVIVMDKVNPSQAISGASIVLSLSPMGLGGELTDITGTTDSSGEFVTTFSSDNVTVDTLFSITAHVSMDGYDDANKMTSISVARDPTIVSESLDRGFLDLPAPSFLVVMVMLAAMSMIYAVYRRKE